MIILRPFIELLITVIDLYRYVLIAWIIMSWMKSFDLINSYHPAIRKIMDVLNRLTEPLLYQIRRYVPPLGGLDLSSVVLLLMIGFTKSVLISLYH